MIKLQVDFSFVKNYLRKKKNVELLTKDNDEELFIEVSFFYQVVTATFMLVRLWFYQGICNNCFLDDDSYMIQYDNSSEEE